MPSVKKNQTRKKLNLFPYKQAKSALVDGIENALSITRNYSKFTRYSLAIFSSALFILLKLGLEPLMGEDSTFLLVIPAVLLSAWFGGTGPGILSAILTAGLLWYFFFPPEYSLAVHNLQRSIIDLVIFSMEVLGIIFIVHRRNKAYFLMQERTAQQALIATIGQYGLEESDITSLVDKIVRAVSKAVHVEFVRVLEIVPETTSLHYRSGIGWTRNVRKTLIPMEGTLAGSALAHNKPVVMNDSARDRRYEGDGVLGENNIVSGMSVPIMVGNAPFGVIEIYTAKKRKFSKNDSTFLRAMANVLATTIERKNSQQTLSLMASISAVLVSYLDPKKALSGLVKSVVPQFADICEVYVQSKEGRVEQIDSYAIDAQKRKVLIELSKKFPPVPHSKRLAAIALKTGRAQLYPYVDTELLQRIAPESEHLKLQQRLNIKSSIIVPLKVRTRVIGVITFATSDKGNIYSKHDFDIAKEIADRAALALDNAHLYQEAKEAVQARDEFLSIASHELKTPLTSMLLQLQSILHSMKNQSLASFSIEKTMTMLESTIGQSKRLSTLINDLLNISLITTGRLTLEKDKTDLVGLTQEVISRMKNQASVAGVEISYEGEESVMGKWDKVRLEQVVTNLLTNALKYGDKKPISVKVEKNGTKAILAVTDRGIGISKDQQSVIFKRFERAGGVKKSYKGLGVGLYLANQIVKSHGGTIHVTSQPKKGSTFTVELPYMK